MCVPDVLICPLQWHHPTTSTSDKVHVHYMWCILIGRACSTVWTRAELVHKKEIFSQPIMIGHVAWHVDPAAHVALIRLVRMPFLGQLLANMCRCMDSPLWRTNCSLKNVAHNVHNRLWSGGDCPTMTGPPYGATHRKLLQPLTGRYWDGYTKAQQW
jgi:hypothetical protein